jgi:hypothetical protein
LRLGRSAIHPHPHLPANAAEPVEAAANEKLCPLVLDALSRSIVCKPVGATRETGDTQQKACFAHPTISSRQVPRHAEGEAGFQPERLVPFRDTFRESGSSRDSGDESEVLEV